MNIFITSSDPTEAAQALDDLRLNKMILETAQLLSGAARLLFNIDESLIADLYKLTHKNHPCSVWARANKHNFLWLLNHFHALACEKHHRTGKWHLSYLKLYKPLLGYVLSIYSADEVEKYTRNNPTFSFNCTDFKAQSVHDSYQLQMVKKWRDDVNVAKRTPTWQNRGMPDWAFSNWQGFFHSRFSTQGA